MVAGERFMRNKFNIIPLFIFLLCICVIQGKYADAQTEGFNVKTPTQKIADSAQSFVKHLTGDLNDNHIIIQIPHHFEFIFFPTQN